MINHKNNFSSGIRDVFVWRNQHGGGIRDTKYNTRKNGRSTYSEEEGEKKATEGNNSIITVMMEEETEIMMIRSSSFVCKIKNKKYIRFLLIYNDGEAIAV